MDQNKTEDKAAFIIGNGVSRKAINLHSLVDVAPIFGCNALCRDFKMWNYLIAIDEGMIDEIREYHMRYGMVIFPDENERWESAEYSPNRRRSNAGMNAMDEAIKRRYTHLYCLGFDFILDGDISVDNVYKNTKNYGKETHAKESDNYHRIKYLDWFANKHSDTTFIFVIPEDAKVKRMTSKNIIGMPTSVFIDKIAESK